MINRLNVPSGGLWGGGGVATKCSLSRVIDISQPTTMKTILPDSRTLAQAIQTICHTQTPPLSLCLFMSSSLSSHFTTLGYDFDAGAHGKRVENLRLSQLLAQQFVEYLRVKHTYTLLNL